MTKQTTENPPAFPPHFYDPRTHESGMTLRDYFAAVALQAMLSCDFIQKGFFSDIEKSKKYCENLGIKETEKSKAAMPEYIQAWHASTAYQFADAMLSKRSESNA